MTDQSPSTTNVSSGTEITCQDFLPANDGKPDPSFESFRSLVGHANKWLKDNIEWKVITCETVEFKYSNKFIDSTNMVYRRYDSEKNVRALRLWLQRFPLGEERAQKIGYVNLIPKVIRRHGGGIFDENFEYEGLNDVVKRFNEENKSTKPIHGRIITIETHPYRVGYSGTVDPEFTYYTEYASDEYQFVFVVRIFYEVGEPMMEKIGFQDFIPTSTRNCIFPICRQYQDFYEMTERASKWCLRQTNLTICYNQILMLKLPGTLFESSSTPNPNKMSYTRRGMINNWYHRPTNTEFVRILRVAFIRLQSGVKVPFVRFTCKSFVPVLRKSGICLAGIDPEFEPLQDTVQRASDWLQETGAKVLNIETSSGRLYKDGTAYSSGVMYYTLPSCHDKYHFFIIRVYVDGEYSEEIEQSDALISAHSCCCTIQ